MQSAERITQGNRQRRIPPWRSEAVAECYETVEKSTLLVLGEVWLKSDRILGVHSRSFSDSASIAERPKLSDPAHGTQRLQTTTPCRVRCSAWLGRVIMITTSSQKHLPVTTSSERYTNPAHGE